MKSVFRAFIAAPAFVLLCIFSVLKRWVEIRLMVVAFHKYGHLALEPELALLEIEDEAKLRQGKYPKVLTLWSFGPRRHRANPYLVKKWKTELMVVPSWWMDSLIRVGSVFPKIGLSHPQLSIQRPMQQLASTPSRLTFSKHEMRKAKSELSLIGIDVLKPFVCLVVRDEMHYGDVVESDDPNYLSHVFDVEEFVPAARELVRRGYQVVRMGAGKERPLIAQIEGVVDYAKCARRTPFLDVYLAANCAFAVSTQTGPDAVCLLFRHPVCFVDIPVFSQFFFGTELAVWNPCTLIDGNRKIPLDEILLSGKAWAKTAGVLHGQNIGGVRLSAKEIELSVSEFVGMYENSFALCASDEEICINVNKRISMGLGELGARSFGQIRARMSPAYIRRNADWFLQ